MAATVKMSTSAFVAAVCLVLLVRSSSSSVQLPAGPPPPTNCSKICSGATYRACDGARSHVMNACTNSCVPVCLESRCIPSCREISASISASCDRSCRKSCSAYADDGVQSCRSSVQANLIKCWNANACSCKCHKSCKKNT